jgi:arsenate reductase (thioredoxin)
MTKRLFICVFMLSAFFVSLGQRKPCRMVKNLRYILFVSSDSGSKSLIAAAYFNKFAQEHNLNYMAFGRAANLDTNSNTLTAVGLANDSFAVRKWTPKLVHEIDMKIAYKIIDFNSSMPFKDNESLKVEKWNGIPIMNNEFVRNLIVERVKQLIKQLPKLKTSYSYLMPSR